jgi:hypothetical protein
MAAAPPVDDAQYSIEQLMINGFVRAHAAPVELR